MKRTSRNKVAVLIRAAHRTRTRPEYLGWLLARYKETERKTDEELAHLLGASVRDFHRLHLCLRPRHEFFARDVQQIAAKFGADASNLAKVIRHMEALEGMKDDRAAHGASERGLLLAARARSDRRRSPGRGKKNGARSK